MSSFQKTRQYMSGFKKKKLCAFSKTQNPYLIWEKKTFTAGKKSSIAVALAVTARVAYSTRRRRGHGLVQSCGARPKIEN